ncbi:MAG: transporter, partial [Gammaproteobacteria bacterium]|nr:transporter [Gammaproteobacteria bacterium]
MPAIKRSKRLILWVVTLALFLETLDATIITTAIPQISYSLNVNPLALKAALTSYLLSIAVFIPISSWAAEKYGTKNVFFSAMVVFTLGSIFCGLAVNLTGLVLARILQGMGGALMTPVARMVLARLFSKTELLKVTSYVTIPALVGPMLGPMVGGFITTFLSWRWIFFVNIPFAMYGLYFTYRYFINIRARRAPKLDKLGFILFAIASVSFTFGFEMLGEHYVPFKVVIFALNIGVVGLFAYWLHAKQRSKALFDLSLFQNQTFRWALLGNAWNRLGIGGISFILPLLFQLGLGYTPLHSGCLMMPLALGLLLMKFGVNKIINKFGFKKVLMVNTMVLALSILTFTLITKTTPEIIIIILLFLLGLISSLQYSAMNTLVLADISAKKT